MNLPSADTWRWNVSFSIWRWIYREAAIDCWTFTFHSALNFPPNMFLSPSSRCHCRFRSTNSKLFVMVGAYTAHVLPLVLFRYYLPCEMSISNALVFSLNGIWVMRFVLHTVGVYVTDNLVSLFQSQRMGTCCGTVGLDPSELLSQFLYLLGALLGQYVQLPPTKIHQFPRSWCRP